MLGQGWGFQLSPDPLYSGSRLITLRASGLRVSENQNQNQNQETRSEGSTDKDTIDDIVQDLHDHRYSLATLFTPCLDGLRGIERDTEILQGKIRQEIREEIGDMKRTIDRLDEEIEELETESDGELDEQRTPAGEPNTQ